MSKLKQCKTCGREIAVNAKACPECGGKNNKPFYKKVWFWVVAVIIICAFGGGSDEQPTTSTETTTETLTTTEKVEGNIITDQPKEEVKEEEKVPTEYKSALKQAKTYSEMMHMSKKAIYDQLVSEYGGQFTEEAAQYAIDNLTDVDWNKNALESAKTYQDMMAMSPKAIYDQLVSEYGGQFTAEEAQYAIDNLE